MKRSLVSLLLCGAGCGKVEPIKTESIEPPVNATSAGSVAEAGTLALTGTLVTADADSAADELVYTVASLPTHGELMRDGEALAVGDTFTQGDVNAGKVSYVNNGAEKTSDAFTWTLSDGTNEIGPTSYVIAVTPVNDAPVVVNNVLTTIAEGGSEVLTDSKLSVSDVETPTPLTFTVVSINRGTMQLKVNGTFGPLAVGGTFTQQDVVDGNVKFIDSGVDDASLAAGQPSLAAFSWRVSDAEGAISPSPTDSNVTSFTVTPVDDAATVAWTSTRCWTPNGSVNANPVSSLVDPDNPASAYQICITSLVNGQTITYQTGSTIGVTTSITPTVKNGSVTLGVGSCVQADSLAGLTLTTTATDYGGGVYWSLRKSGTEIAASSTTFSSLCP